MAMDHVSIRRSVSGTFYQVNIIRVEDEFRRNLLEIFDLIAGVYFLLHISRHIIVRVAYNML